ncbi:MAG TPA: hypothetical protein VK604_07030 [Bryobacteraceae bacterium]|nr:hypothetical protein [Bryobacteraceae bacterium]
MTRNLRHFSILSISLLLAAAALNGKDKHPKGQPDVPQDQIAVVAHIPLTGGPVTRFLTTDHYRRNYLYAERESGKALTLIDVTQTSRPAVLADMTYPAGRSDNLVAVAGNAALVSSSASNAAPAAPQTFRIMSFTDPLQPAVKQEFIGVTAMARDDKRGLIFLANAEGVWVLQEKYAMDPAYQKEWEHMTLDAR